VKNVVNAMRKAIAFCASLTTRRARDADIARKMQQRAAASMSKGLWPLLIPR
jgi:hypothetical protein